MAGDWIKFRPELETHPRFLRLCADLIYGDEPHGLLYYACGDDALAEGFPRGHETVTERALQLVTERALRDVTLVALMRVWCALNAHCKVSAGDALMQPMRLNDLDSVAGFDGFGEALERAGWVRVEDGNTLVFPNFLEFNEPACLRRPPAKTPAERQREKRERDASRNVTNVTPEKRREDQRREESKIHPPHTPPDEESKPRSSKSRSALSQEQQARFDRWYSVYPKRVSVAQAVKAWSKLKPDDELVGKMIAAVKRQEQTRQWIEGFIPNPATWLNGRRWEDDAGALDLGKSDTYGTTRKDDYEARQEEGMRKLRELLAAKDAAEKGPGVPSSGRSAPQTAGGLF
jgi:hypothetical protein